MNNLKDFYEFAAHSPWLTFFLGCLIASIINNAVSWPFKIVNRWIRHRNIVAKSWLPDHLDADGDWRKED